MYTEKVAARYDHPQQSRVGSHHPPQHSQKLASMLFSFLSAGFYSVDHGLYSFLSAGCFSADHDLYSFLFVSIADHDLAIPLQNTEFFKRSLQYSGVSIWNKLLISIGNSSSLHTFKVSLYKFIVDKLIDRT